MFDEFDTDKQDTAEFTKGLVARALSGKHSEREYIRNFAELSVARTLRSATKQVVKGFTSAANEAYEAYIKNLKNNIDDLSLIINHLTYRKCVEFYQAELELIEDEINEFYNYAFLSGNFIKIVLFGYDRPDEHLKDSRSLSWWGDSDDEE